MGPRSSVPSHAHTWWRLVAGAIAAATLTLSATLAFVTTASADDPFLDPATTTTTTPTPVGTVDDVSATLDGYGPFVIEKGQSLSAKVRLTNDAVDPVPAVSLSLAVTKQPLSSREELALFFDDPGSQSMRTVKTVPVGEPELDEDDEPLDTGTLAPGASPQVRVAASSKDLDLPAGTAGVYGVITSYKVGKSKVMVDTMAMTWLDTDVASLPVTAIATIAGQPSRVASLLNGANIDGVTMAVDPSALTSAAPLDALNDRELYALPATHPDVASLAHAGDESLINFAVDQSRTRDWMGLANVPWLALSSVADDSVVKWADASGAFATLFAGDPAITAPDIGDVDGWVPALTTVKTADDHRASLLVPDATLSNLVATFRPSDPAGPSRIVAESALLAFEGDGSQGVVVAPGLDWVVSQDGPSPNLAALMDAPWVTVRPVTEAITDTQGGTEKLPKTQDLEHDVPVEHIDGLTARLAALTRLSATADNPDSLLVPGGRVLLNAVSSTARGNADWQAAAFESSTRVTDATLSSVSIVQSSDVNLIATSGQVPITVHNDLGVASTVTVIMRSTSPNLQVRDHPVITVPARGEATAMVPVEAVSTADVTINVWLTNPKGDPVSDAQNFTMRVRADWGNAATAVFTVLLVLVLIAGIVRTIRRGRKDTRTGPGAPAEAAESIAVPDPTPEPPGNEGREQDGDARG